MTTSRGAKANAASGGSEGKKRIGELLVDAGLISGRQLMEALHTQTTRGEKTVDTLIYLGHMNPEQFVRFLASQPGTPSISLRNYHITDELLKLVPKEFAQRHEVFPIDRMGRLLTVGMVCPLDSAAIVELEEITGLKVKPMLCTHTEIRWAIGKYYGQKGEYVFDPDIVRSLR